MSAAMSFDDLRALAEEDDGVVGLVLGGSRGKGAFVDASSDFDTYVIVREHTDARRLRLSSRRGEPVEILVLTLDEFRAHAAPNSESAWNRYSFAHVRAEVDKLDGEIQRLVDEKGSLAPG
jgi:Nucleotidyltransferase domain